MRQYEGDSPDWPRLIAPHVASLARYASVATSPMVSPLPLWLWVHRKFGRSVERHEAGIKSPREIPFFPPPNGAGAAVLLMRRRVRGVGSRRITWSLFSIIDSSPPDV